MRPISDGDFWLRERHHICPLVRHPTMRRTLLLFIREALQYGEISLRQLQLDRASKG